MGYKKNEGEDEGKARGLWEVCISLYLFLCHKEKDTSTKDTS